MPVERNGETSVDVNNDNDSHAARKEHTFGADNFTFWTFRRPCIEV